MPGVTVSDLELHREGKSYTSDTVSALRAEYPDAELFLLVGTDMLRTFHEWYEFREILSDVTLVATARDDDGAGDVRRHAERLEREYGARVEVIETPPLPLSSTQIRRLLPERHGAEFLAPKVYERIIKERLYDAKPSLDYLRENRAICSCNRAAWPTSGAASMRPEGLPSAGAPTWNLPLRPEFCMISRKNSRFLNNCYCQKNMVLLTIRLNWQMPNSLHAKTGAAMAKDLFGVPAEVENAIRWHTTGHPEMTLLEQIIYLADYIEPTRDFPGVERLRALAYEDLRAAMILGLEMGLEEIRAEGREPHENSVRALEWFRREVQA